MAIEKAITKENGIVLHYHRVVSVNGIANHDSIIEVASYVDHAQRKIEADALANSKPMDVYVSTRYVNAPYDPNMGITGAYQYIKGIEPYNDPQDVFEEGNDPVAVAGVVASGAMSIEDVPEEQRAEIEELIPNKPEKVGFIAVPRVEPMGYRVVWEFEPDPNYQPDQPDGSYLKPYPFEPGMTVEVGMWYTDGEDIWECIEAGVADAFTAPWFDVIEV